MVVDSKLSLDEALAQNPDAPAPEEVLGSIGLMEVTYLGFDNKQHLGQIVVAQEVMPEVEAFFDLSRDIGFPIHKVIPAPVFGWDDKALMAANVTSGFNYRLITGTDRLSLHATGRAFDVNPVQNPYIRYENNRKMVYPKSTVWDANIPGTLSAGHPLVNLMKGFGWEWGGDWLKQSGRIDYQHFQKP